MIEADINYLAVLVATVVFFALGALWYSPILFAKPFMAAMGKTQEELMEGFNPLRTYGSEFLARLVTAYVLAHIVIYAGATTIGAGLQTGFGLWLGFVVTSGLATVTFEGRSFVLYALSAGYQLVGLLMMGATLAVWT